MNYERLLALTDIDVDSLAVFAAIRQFAPGAKQLTVIVQQPAPQFAWLTTAAPPDLNDATRQALDAVRQAAGNSARDVEVTVTPVLSADALETIAGSAIDLVVVGCRPLRTLALAAEVRKRRSAPVLCVPSAPKPPGDAAGARLLCVGFTPSVRAAMERLLRDHAGPADTAVLLSSKAIPSLRELLAPEQPFDLVVLGRLPSVPLLGITSGPSVLVLPPERTAPREWQRAIDVPDLVDDGAVIRMRVEYAFGVGRRTPITDQELAFVRSGEVVCRSNSRYGEVELPTGAGTSLGVFRTYGKETVDASASVEQSVSILRAAPGTIVLFDAEIDEAGLSLIRNVHSADAVAVRVRSVRSCASLRSRLREAGLPPRVIDAGAVLGEGEAPDVPAHADAVRLARAAARMRADGFPIAAIVYRGPHKPATRGFAALLPEEIPAFASQPTVRIERACLAERLDATTGSDVSRNNRIEVELDNTIARHWLLSAINDSRHRLHFQVYMAADDDVGRPVEAALAAAGARGVRVRVLVDSLHGLHGSFGARNPILERLSSRPGVELRLSRPITGLPSLEDLKQRNHRKLVVADGSVALLGGRNLSHEYYTGFQEVALRPDTTWRMVPWLDAGARVEGPAVGRLEHAFLEAWTDAGGDRFDIADPPPAGNASARVVVHRGLRDAYTVEAYLALIETARSHIYAVNGFPLLLEIQHALLRALRRGVRVRTIFGNLTPKYGDESFKGPLAAPRTLATSFVHSRMDALIAAGGECYEFVVPRQEGWDPAVGEVRPHVHAKAMSADGRVCAVGSANLDITAGYWESELLLVVVDETITRAVEVRLAQLVAGSHRVDRNDPAWRRRADQREWMRYWPGVLSG